MSSPSRPSSLSPPPGQPPAIQKHPRYRLQAPIDVLTALSEHKGLPLENISLGGAFICTDEPPPPGAKVKLSFGATDEVQENIQVVGRVVHVIDGRQSALKSHPPGMGVQFEGLSLESEARLKRLVDGLALRARRERVKRAGARFADHATVYVRPERELLAELWDESLKHGGLFAEGDAPPFGTQLSVVIGPLHVRGEVVHVQGHGAGLQLKDWEGAKAEAVRRFIARETDAIVFRDDSRPVGPPLGKVLAVVRRLFGGLEEDDPLGALGLPPTAHENEVKNRAEGLRRLFAVKPPGATPPQLARIDAALRAVARVEPLALARVAAIRREAELAVAGRAGEKEKEERLRDDAKKLVAEATSLELRGMRVEARRCLERALELVPGDENAQRRLDSLNHLIDVARAADLLSSAEVFVLGVGMKEQAIRHAREAARLVNVREVRLRAIRVLAKAGQTGDAELLAQELLEQDPRDALALQALMIIYEKTRQWREAAQAGEALVRLKPGDPDLARRVKRIVEEARRQKS